MNTKQIMSIILFALGLGALFASHYITTQVIEGKGKIASAQGKVDTSKKIFSLTPVTKKVGEGLTQSAQNEIDAGREEVKYYEWLAGSLRIGGMIALIVGVVGFFFCRSKS